LIFTKSAKCNTFSFFEWNNDLVLNPYDEIDLTGEINTKSSPKDEFHMFKFPLNPFPEYKEDMGLTCITQNSKQIGIKNEDVQEKIQLEKHANCIENLSNMENERASDASDLNEILAPLIKRKITSHGKNIRRDVVNKTIFRIIRRFFLNMLEKAVPDYKKQKKTNLMNMLISFSEFLFPQLEDHSKIGQVMSALMFRRELLLLKDKTLITEEMKVFMDIQSKYTHKLLRPAMSNKYFKILFNYFLINGIEFFDQDENVVSNSDQYTEEFQKIKQLLQTSFD
jgi:hypothetical protein